MMVRGGRSVGGVLVCAWLLASSGCEGGAPVGAGEIEVEDPRIPWLEAGEPEIAAPEIPWYEAGQPFVLDSCPTGWRLLHDEDGVPSCEPWPEGGREVCAAPEQAHLPGEPGCATLARVAAGEWADGLPAAGVLYVRPGALGGTGARAEPFGTIAEAIAAASPGTIVALARGRYDEAVLVDRSLTLRGAGPATVLAPLGAAEAPAIDVTAEGVRLEDLAIAGVDRMGARVRGRGDVDASGLVVDGARDRGILVEEGGKLRIRDSIIRNLREDPSTRSAHGGLHASTGATVEMSSCLLEANLAHGALIEGPGTTASFTDTAIVDSRQDALRFFGENVFVDFGARVTLTRVVSERGHLVGVIGEGDGVELTIDDSVLRDTQDGMIGGGEPFQMPLQCGQGASCTVRGTLIERSENGLFAAYQDGTLRIERCILRDAGEQSFASRGARVEIVSSIFARTLVSAATFGSGVIGLVEDLLVIRNAPLVFPDEMPPRSTGGTAISANGARSMEIRRLVVRDSLGSGVGGTSTSLRVTDMIIERPLPDEGEILLAAREAISIFNADAIVERLVSRGFRGVQALYGATVVVTDVSIEGGRSGAFASAQRSFLDVSRARVTGAPSVANAVQGGIVMTDVVARELVLPDMGTGGTTGFSTLGGTIEVSRMLIDDVPGTVARSYRDPRPIMMGEPTRSMLTFRDVVAAHATEGGFLSAGGDLVLERVRLERPSVVAVHVSEAGTAELTDVRVVDSRSRDVDGLYGRGLQVDSGASLHATRLHVEGAREVGVMVAGVGSTAVLVGAAIEHVQAQDCEANDACTGRGGGIGLAVLDSAFLDASNFLVRAARRTGVLVAGGAMLELSAGTVVDCGEARDVQGDAASDASFADVALSGNDTVDDGEPIILPPVELL